MVGWGRKSYLRPAEIAFFFSAVILAEAISMAHSDMLYRLDIYTVYFYEPLLLQISLPTITFKVNNYANNFSDKYIYLFQILHSMKSVFLLKCTCRF